MTAFTPIRSDNAYFAAAKQTSQGTAATPNYFFRWLDGSALEPDLKTEELWEGDGSRRLSQVFKNGQKWKIKLLIAPRPDGLGFLEAGSLGVGSDTPGTQFSTATTTTAIVANTSTSATLGTVSGLPATGNVSLMLNQGSANEETVVFTMPPVGNVVTVASTYNGGKFAQAHGIGAPIIGAVTHTMTDQIDGPYYTWEVCLGGLNGAAGDIVRLVDCKVNSIKRYSEKGKPLYLELEIVGIACSLQVSPTTQVYENRQIFMFTQSVFTVDGATTGDAAGINKFSIEQKNNTDEDIQTTAITMVALMWGNINMKIALDLIVQTLSLFHKTYLGSATGTADSQNVVTGSLKVVFTQPDGFHTVTYTVGTVAYIQSKPPAPKKDGKHMQMSVESTATSNMGQNAALITAVITNVVTGAYA